MTHDEYIKRRDEILETFAEVGEFWPQAPIEKTRAKQAIDQLVEERVQQARKDEMLWFLDRINIEESMEDIRDALRERMLTQRQIVRGDG